MHVAGDREHGGGLEQCLGDLEWVNAHVAAVAMSQLDLGASPVTRVYIARERCCYLPLSSFISFCFPSLLPS